MKLDSQRDNLEKASSSDSENGGGFIKVKRRKFSRKPLWKRFIIAVLAIAAVYFVAVSTKFLSALRKVSVNDAEARTSIFNFVSINSNQLSGEGKGRVNIALIGIGGKNHPGGNLADTIIVASLDTRRNKLALLSIPRDLYVPYPKPYKGGNKINAIHSFGEQNKTKIKGGGPEFLKKALSNTLGIPIHYFIRVDFQAFKNVVDVLGGVKINVEKTIDDPYYPAANMIDYDPFYLSAGVHILNGDTALKYVRSRKTTSDFDRAKRQQKVLGAVKDKALSIGVLSNPKKIFKLIDVFGNHFKTDLQPNEFQRLIKLAKNIDADSVITKVLTNGPDGPLISVNDNGYYLKPRIGSYKEIQAIAEGIFDADLIESEKVPIAIFNASGTSGLANKLKADLVYRSYNVLKTEFLPLRYDKTVVYSAKTKSNKKTVHLLEKKLGVKALSAIPEDLGAKAPDAEIIIVVGRDYAKNKQLN